MIKMSIIIPVYNREMYIRECLDSIFHQTIKDIEVICVDDGSTDNSLNIMHDYQEKYANITIISQGNMGSGMARNKGISLSKGKYLMSVDPDDFLASDNALEMLYEAAEKYNATVCGGCLVRYEDGHILEEKRKENDGVKEEGVFYFKNYQNPYFHTRYIINREWLAAQGICYPNYRRGQDMPFMAEVLNRANSFYMLNKDVYAYRKQHKVEVFTEEKARDYISSCCDVLRLAIDNHLERLFNMMNHSIVEFSKQNWYRLLAETDEWTRITEVNKLISEGNAAFQYESSLNCLMDKEEYGRYIQEVNRELEQVINRIKQSKKLAIYGAGGGGKLIYKYLLSKGCIPYCFVVSDKEKNEKAIDEISVIPLDGLNDADDYLFVLSGMKPKMREEMKKNLGSKGCHNILDFDCKKLQYLL